MTLAVGDSAEVNGDSVAAGGVGMTTREDSVLFVASGVDNNTQIFAGKLWFCQWEFQDPKLEVLYHIRPFFGGDIPLHRPYIGLIYGRYHWFCQCGGFLRYPSYPFDGFSKMKQPAIFWIPHDLWKPPERLVNVPYAQAEKYWQWPIYSRCGHKQRVEEYEHKTPKIASVDSVSIFLARQSA